jgi:hypothetical protein
MSPQTYRSQLVARSRSRTGTVLSHEMTVVASTVVDVVASTGGWLFDRRMAGWQVNVLVADRTGERALKILGAEVLDLSGDLEVITDDPDRAVTVAAAADLYAVDARVRQLISTSDRRRVEVALWGETDSLRENLSAVSYRLTAAARAFKGQAMLAAGMPGPVHATEPLFRCGVTALAPAR